jgi:hypothetical protein
MEYNVRYDREVDDRLSYTIERSTIERYWITIVVSRGYFVGYDIHTLRLKSRNFIICDPLSPIHLTIHAADWMIAITRFANPHSTSPVSIDRHLP